MVVASGGDLLRQDTSEFDRIQLLGVSVANVTPEEAIRHMRRFLQEDGLHHVAVVNTNKFWLAHHVSGILDILQSAEMVISEYGGVWAARVFGTPLKANVRGVGVFLSLIPKLEEWGEPTYFLGARKEVLDALLRRARHKYPRLQIAGSRCGFYESADEEAIVSEINSSGAKVLFVAMGSPRQEYFIERHRAKLSVRLAMGVGGSFDVLAGLKKDAPAWSHCGIEWLYRLWLDPKNLLKRYLRVHPWFVWHTLRTRISERRFTS